MATVHPSRMALVPQDNGSRDDTRSSDYDKYRNRDKDRARDNDREYRSSSYRDDDRQRRDRDAYRGRDRDSRKRSASRSRSGSTGRDDRGRQRRRSPDYSSYRKDGEGRTGSYSGNNNTMGPPESVNMYASRSSEGRGGNGFNAYNSEGGGDDYFARHAFHLTSCVGLSINYSFLLFIAGRTNARIITLVFGLPLQRGHQRTCKF